MSHTFHRLWKCYKTLTFCSLLAGCRIPWPCDAKRRFNIQKWRKHVVFLAFWLRNVLRATTAYTFWTSQLPKELLTWCAFYILTWKCALRHNGVHFFDIATSKSVRAHQFLTLLTWKCALRHNGVNFFDIATSKSAPNGEAFFSFFTCKCVWRHNGVQFVISHLPRWLQARRFSEPTFRPSGATNHSWRFKTLEKSLSSRCLPAFPANYGLDVKHQKLLKLLAFGRQYDVQGAF